MFLAAKSRDFISQHHAAQVAAGIASVAHQNSFAFIVHYARIVAQFFYAVLEKVRGGKFFGPRGARLVSGVRRGDGASNRRPPRFLDRVIHTYKRNDESGNNANRRRKAPGKPTTRRKPLAAFVDNYCRKLRHSPPPDSLPLTES